jgi:hypothetical protein
MAVADGFEHHWVGDPAGLISSWRAATTCPTFLLISPFAEEQGRCRRLQYDISAALAKEGLNGCWLDLPGTGDSPLDETGITADKWLAAVNASVNWCETAGRHLALVGGLRLGAAVAIGWAQQQFTPPTIAAVEAVAGPSALRNLLRTRLASNGKTIEDLLKSIQNGETIDAAGYPLNKSVTDTLEQFNLPEMPLLGITKIRSTLSDLPPWFQVEPKAATALALDLARQLAELHQGANQC